MCPLILDATAGVPQAPASVTVIPHPSRNELDATSHDDW
jgi:hypothetical protein